MIADCVETRGFATEGTQVIKSLRVYRVNMLVALCVSCFVSAVDQAERAPHLATTASLSALLGRKGNVVSGWPIEAKAILTL
jgi:hypothetical protein